MIVLSCQKIRSGLEKRLLKCISLKFFIFSGSYAVLLRNNCKPNTLSSFKLSFNVVTNFINILLHWQGHNFIPSVSLLIFEESCTYQIFFSANLYRYHFMYLSIEQLPYLFVRFLCFATRYMQMININLRDLRLNWFLLSFSLCEKSWNFEIFS